MSKKPPPKHSFTRTSRAEKIKKLEEELAKLKEGE